MPGAKSEFLTTTGVFVVHEDRLVFPYCAYSGDAGNGRSDMYGGGSVGLASLRRDGFASMDAGKQPGVLTTRLVKFKGRYLFVNVNGEVSVEVLDDAGKVLRSSMPGVGDQTKLKMEWTDGADLSGVAGENVRFRFHLKKGSLFAFWVTPDENGASNGYVGAGGPAFPGTREVRH